MWFVSFMVCIYEWDCIQFCSEGTNCGLPGHEKGKEKWERIILLNRNIYVRKLTIKK